MLLRTLIHRQPDGWLAPLPRELDSPQTLVLAFAASAYAHHPAALDELGAAFPQSVLVGCSTSGEIAGEQVFDAGISVAVARFSRTRLRPALTAVGGAADSRAAGQRLAAQIPGAGLRAVFLLSDGLNVDGTALVEGLAAALPRGVAITGGLAGDGGRFENTWVLDGARPVQRHVSAVGLYGEGLHVSLGCDGGWSDFGPARRITRSAGNILHELDGQPALDLYRASLGERAVGLPGAALLLPMSVRRPGAAAGDTLVRTILGIDEAGKSITFTGDMPEGAVSRLMRTSHDHLIDSAHQAVWQAAQGLPSGEAPLVISVSGAGRRLVLGERTHEEVETVFDVAPARAGHVGFYAYGEIAPAPGGSGTSEMHNEKVAVTVLSEV